MNPDHAKIRQVVENWALWRDVGDLQPFRRSREQRQRTVRAAELTECRVVRGHEDDRRAVVERALVFYGLRDRHIRCLPPRTRAA